MIGRRHTLALLAGLPALSARAQPGSGPAGSGLFEAGAPSHTITRHAFDSVDGKRRYRVDLAVPQGEPPKHGWPSLYFLDGNAAFTILTSEDLANSPGLALAAVGYDTDQRFDNLARTFDYTPAVAGQPENPERPEGGSAAFRHLLLQTIRPRIERLGKLDPRKAALWGHSYGALFVLDTLRRNPDAFSFYLAISPSLWWQGGTITALPFASPHQPVRLALMVGDREARQTAAGPPTADDFAASVARVRALNDQIGATSNIATTLTVLSGQSHGGALTTSLPLALSLTAEDRP